jgi:flavin reductase (DIM6/NTAB) family NADH-FMN oxidoreductase RutF
MVFYLGQRSKTPGPTLSNKKENRMKKSIGAITMAFPTPTWVVGTYDSEGKPNVMTAAWGGICCSNPPCVGVSLREATYTYGAIMERKAFTVNVPSEAHTAEADFFGIASGRNVDKFAVSGLTPVRSDLVDAPYVKEFPLALECKLLNVNKIGLHTHFVGEILDVKADESMLGENGLPDIEKVKPIIFSPFVHTYHGVGKLLGKAFSIGVDLSKG